MSFVYGYPCIGDLSSGVDRDLSTPILNEEKHEIIDIFAGSLFHSLGPITANEQSYSVCAFELGF